MASHYDCIGFGGADGDELEELFRRAADEATALPCKKGTYLRWTCDTGAELWLQVSRRQELIGAHPHFNGDGDCAVALTRSVASPGDSELDGAFHGWANPSPDAPESGDLAAGAPRGRARAQAGRRVLRGGGPAVAIGHPIARRLFDHPREDRFDVTAFAAALDEAGLPARATERLGSAVAWFTATKAARS
jgi:hypothetical protein